MSKKNAIVCPAKCSAGYKADSVTQRRVEITLEIIRAASLMQDENLARCKHCGCVRRNVFGSNLSTQMDILGDYDGMNSTNVFLPAPWLQKVILEFEK